MLSTWKWRKSDEGRRASFRLSLSDFLARQQDVPATEGLITRIREFVREAISEEEPENGNGENGNGNGNGENGNGNGNGENGNGENGNGEPPPDPRSPTEWPAPRAEAALAWTQDPGNVYIQGLNNGHYRLRQGGVPVANFTARSSDGESPSMYSVTGGGFTRRDECMVWGDLPTTEETDPFPTEPSWTVRASASLRDQTITADADVYVTPIEGIRSITTDAGYHSAWDWALPTPAPLADVNFAALWRIISSTEWWTQFGQSIGSTLAGTFGNIINGEFRLDTARWNLENPFRGADFPLNFQWGGVIYSPGYIPLDFISEFQSSFVTHYEVSIGNSNMWAVAKPFSDDIITNSAGTAFRSYGWYAVFGPRRAHSGTIRTTLSVTARMSHGASRTVTFNVQSQNPSNNQVPPPDTITSLVQPPTSNALNMADLRLPLPGGVDRSEAYLFDNTPLVFFFPGLETEARDFGHAVEADFDFEAHTGSNFQFIRTGKVLNWQLAWATPDSKGSVRLMQTSWYPRLPEDTTGGLDVVTTNGFVPPADREYRDHIGGNTPDSFLGPRGGIPFGPHLTLKATAEGLFAFYPNTGSYGSTMIQIKPYVQEWNAWTFPVPYLGRFGNRALQWAGTLVSGRLQRVSAVAYTAYREALFRQRLARAAARAGGERVSARFRTAAIGRLLGYGAQASGLGAGSAGIAVGVSIANREASQFAVDQSVNTANRQIHRSFSQADTDPSLTFSEIGEPGWNGPPVINNVYWTGDRMVAMIHNVGIDPTIRTHRTDS